MRIVIIGNGVAGIEAALAVRAKQKDWDIAIISEESDHFFSRTALMYVLSGQMRYRDIEPYERDLYQRARFRRIRARAVGLDLAERRVKLAAGFDAVPYDRLLIASGSRPRPPPWPGGHLAGIGHFVTLQDLEWLEAEIHGGPAAGRPPRPDTHLRGVGDELEDSPAGGFPSGAQANASSNATHSAVLQRAAGGFPSGAQANASSNATHSAVLQPAAGGFPSGAQANASSNATHSGVLQGAAGAFPSGAQANASSNATHSGVLHRAAGGFPSGVPTQARSAPISPYAARPLAAKTRGRRARKVAIIGGGLIGAEVVETVLAARVEPHFIIREEWFWPMAIDRREAEWVADRMRAHGVRMYLEHEIEGFDGDPQGNVASVRTSRGAIACDIAVVAIGVMPNTEWLAGSGIALDAGGGIIAGAGLETNDPNVWAAGDCASVRWYDGARRPEQLWYTARDQGRVAGRRLLGESARYDRGIWYNSAKLMDIEYTTVGLVPQKLVKERDWYFEETGPVRSTTRIILDGDRVIGMNLLGRRWDHSVLIRWIEEQRTLGYVLGRLNEASFDTELVPPLFVPPGAAGG